MPAFGVKLSARPGEFYESVYIIICDCVMLGGIFGRRGWRPSVATTAIAGTAAPGSAAFSAWYRSLLSYFGFSAPCKFDPVNRLPVQPDPVDA
jgi:hypothetical protein